MDTIKICTTKMDFSMDWADWRNSLKETIDKSHTYYQDESVLLLVNQLDKFLGAKVCASSDEEAIMEAMWGAADESQREVLATLLLKISDRI